MATTQDDIRGWLMRGKLQGATNVIIVCDTFDWTDFPVYVMPGEDVRVELDKYHGKQWTTVMEVYNLSLPFDSQLREFRAFHMESEEAR